jgi:hypothetical protein
VALRYEVQTEENLFMVLDKTTGDIVKKGTYGEIEQFLDVQENAPSAPPRRFWSFF